MKERLELTKYQQSVYNEGLLNITPNKIASTINTLCDELTKRSLFTFATSSNPESAILLQLLQLENLMEQSIFFMREWDRINVRVGFQIDLTKVSYQVILTLAEYIREVDEIIAGFGRSDRMGQLQLFQKFIVRGDPDKLTKRMNSHLSETLKLIANLWPDIKPEGDIPFVHMFADGFQRAKVQIILIEVTKQLTSKHSTLARQWSIGTLRDKTQILLTRLEQVLGKFITQPMNGVTYQSHPTRSIGIMKTKDVMNLPFYSERIVIAKKVARFSLRPNLLPELQTDHWDVMILKADSPQSVILRKNRYSIDLVDYQAACFVTTGLPLYQITYLPSRCLACFFVQDTDHVIVVGHKIREENNDA